MLEGKIKNEKTSLFLELPFSSPYKNFPYFKRIMHVGWGEALMLRLALVR